MDTLQTNTTGIGECLCVDGKKLWRWYRDTLSGYLSKENQEKQYKNDIEIQDHGKTKSIRIPILKVENIGEEMAIDEKKIGEEMHTVLTNRKTGKIALLAQTLKSSELAKIIPKFNSNNFKVKSITRDLSNTFDWFSRQAFMNASHTADKFHIISHLLDANQDVRIRYRQELLREKRIKFEKYKSGQKEKKEQAKAKGESFKSNNFRFNEKKLANGETPMELLARSRYLLYKYPGDWTPTQIQRANVLFENYPEIQKAYNLSCKFRTWYRKENVGSDMNQMKIKLHEWFNEVDIADIDELSNFKSLVERNEGVILNYFKHGFTNAIAENMNSKISRFVMINQGTRDREFFYFRLANYFS